MLFNSEKKHIGTILKKLRIENGYSLRALAKEFCIDHSNIHAIEKKNAPPSQFMLEKYHNFFHVSYEYLLGETEDPTNTELGKARFETKEGYALRRIAEENEQCYSTLSYLLTNTYGQVFLEELSICLNNKDLTTLADTYKQLNLLEQKKRNYTQDEVRTFIKNQSKKGDL